MKALLAGDFCPTEANNYLFAQGDIDTLFTDTLCLFNGNDINFVNLECALTESENKIPKFGPHLAASPNTAQVLKSVGVNYVGLSNNHIFDFGKEGAEDTLRYLARAGIAHTGFGENYEASRKNLVVQKDGEKICLITVCELEYSYALPDRMGSRPFDEFDTLDDIRAAAAENDRVIVLYHGGKENCQYPSPRLLKTCRAMARAGADVVLCQHSHCIGCYENFEGSHILYGEGNFHFVNPAWTSAKWNTMLTVQYDTKTHGIAFTPLVTTQLGITLAKGAQKEALLQEFWQRSEALKDGTWRDGWHAFCLSVEETYKKAIRNACAEHATQRQNDVFGHYLDCQAHTDVWRELFPSYNLTNEK